MMNIEKIIDGNAHAKVLLQKVKERLDAFKNQTNGIIPTLVTIRVGDNEASKVYVNLKTKKAREIGILTVTHELPESTSQKILENLIVECNADPTIHGIMLQLPLPSHIDIYSTIDTINPIKDVDGFTVENIGLQYSNRARFVPCTAQGIMLLLKAIFNNNIRGKKAVVLGRSIIVGKPTALSLLQENCSVTILHSHSQKIWQETKYADILVSAVGIPHLIKKELIKPDACVIDVGITRTDGKIVGDVEFEQAIKVAKYITPVPGGVGPMTVACLLNNTLRAAYLQNNIVYEI